MPQAEKRQVERSDNVRRVFGCSLRYVSALITWSSRFSHLSNTLSQIHSPLAPTGNGVITLLLGLSGAA